MKWRENDCNRFLMVEGYSDLTFFAELLQHIGIGVEEAADATPCFIKEFSGKPDLLGQIEAWFTPQKLRDAKAIGIVIDADTSSAASRDGLVDRLRGATGLVFPNEGGWLQHPLGARVGFHVVPGNGPDDQGEIETLVWRAVQASPAHATKVQCVESFLDCMRTSGIDAKKADKARISALLAVLHPEDPRLGPGARAKHFDFQAEPLAALRQFLLGFKAQ